MQSTSSMSSKSGDRSPGPFGPTGPRTPPVSSRRKLSKPQSVDSVASAPLRSESGAYRCGAAPLPARSARRIHFPLPGGAGESSPPTMHCPITHVGNSPGSRAALGPSEPVDCDPRASVPAGWLAIHSRRSTSCIPSTLMRSTWRVDGRSAATLAAFVAVRQVMSAIENIVCLKIRMILGPPIPDAGIASDRTKPEA